MLAEYEVLPFPQAASHEIFAQAVEPEPTEFALTNVQINLTLGAFLVYALTLVIAVRAKLFAVWTGAAAYLSFTAALLLAGLVFWLENERVALAMLSYVPMCLVFAPLAGLLRRRGKGRLGSPVLLLLSDPLRPRPHTARALRQRRSGWVPPAIGTTSRRSSGSWPTACCISPSASPTPRSAAGFARFWGELFMLLVPVSLLVPANVMFENAPYLGRRAGGRGIGVYSYAAIAISIALVVFGTRVRRAALIAPGLIGLAIAIGRFTHLHFQQLLAWPLALAILGGLAMVGRRGPGVRSRPEEANRRSSLTA